MPDPVTGLFDIAASLLDSIVARLEADGVEVPTRRYVHVGHGGAVAWDRTCETDSGHPGQLTVSLVRLFNTRDFPRETNDVYGGCGNGGFMGALFYAEIVRCALTADDNGNPPSHDELTLEAEAGLSVAMSFARGVRCWIDSIDDDAVFGGLVPIGPQGGYVGYGVNVTVEITDACSCY